MGTTAEKGQRVLQSIAEVQEGINNIGGSLTDQTPFKNFRAELDNIYNNLPKTDYEEGSNITLSNCLKGKLDFEDDIVGYGDTKQAIIPSEYQQVEYISNANGTEYIDTGFKCNQDTRVVLDMENTTTSASFIFGARDGNAQKNFCLLVLNNNVLRTDYADSQNNITISSTTDRLLIDKDKNSTIIKKNDVVIASYTATYSSFTPDKNMYLFTINNNGNVGTPEAIIKLYSCKIYNNDVLVRDYIPCYRISDNVIGLYDLVNNTFYTNAGTGTFTKGNNAPTPTTPIPIKTVTGEQDIIIRGINLFNINDYTDITFSTNNSTVTKYETYFKCATNGENFSGAYINTYTINPSIYQALSNYNGKTLRFSFKAKADVSMDLYFGIGSAAQRNTLSTSYQTYSMNVPDYDASKSIVFYNQGTVLAETNFYIKEIQLEVGTTTNPYEPYITPTTKTLNLGNIELAKIGTYRDYIWTDRTTKKWYKHSAIDKFLINSNLQINFSTSTVGYDLVRIDNVTAPNVERPIMSSAFIGIIPEYGAGNVPTNRNANNIYVNYIIQKIDICTVKNAFSSANDFLTQLNGTPIYYAKTTATDTEITDTTFIEQAEEIYNIMSLNGTTKIEIEGDLPMIMKVRANTEGSQPETETKTVKSTTTSQTVNPTSGKLISQITVEPIVLDTVSVTPSTSSQTINPTHDGIGQVNVSAVTSSIDNNIVAGNIKKDVSILGVTGTFEGGSGNVNVEAITSNNMYKNIATVDLSGVTISTTSLSRFFYEYTGLVSVDMPDTSNVTDISYMFYLCTNLEEVPLFNTSSVTNMEGLFLMHSSASAMKGKIIDIPLFDTSHATNMQYTFACTKITTLKQYNTASATNMMSMCEYCKNLVTVPILNTSNVTNLTNAFNQCSSLSNDSLNNILYMCATSSATSNKTLKKVGLTSAQATICQGLSNYSAFIDAGWTTGY